MAQAKKEQYFMIFTLTEDKTLSYFVYRAVKKKHPCISPLLQRRASLLKKLLIEDECEGCVVRHEIRPIRMRYL